MAGIFSGRGGAGTTLSLRSASRPGAANSGDCGGLATGVDGACTTEAEPDNKSIKASSVPRIREGCKKVARCFLLFISFPSKEIR
jgi:hypothetical protein